LPAVKSLEVAEFFDHDRGINRPPGLPIGVGRPG
jgi:hypothetical protein